MLLYAIHTLKIVRASFIGLDSSKCTQTTVSNAITAITDHNSNKTMGTLGFWVTPHVYQNSNHEIHELDRLKNPVIFYVYFFYFPFEQTKVEHLIILTWVKSTHFKLNHLSITKVKVSNISTDIKLVHIQFIHIYEPKKHTICRF